MNKEDLTQTIKTKKEALKQIESGLLTIYQYITIVANIQRKVGDKAGLERNESLLKQVYQELEYYHSLLNPQKS